MHGVGFILDINPYAQVEHDGMARVQVIVFNQQVMYLDFNSLTTSLPQAQMYLHQCFNVNLPLFDFQPQLQHYRG